MSKVYKITANVTFPEGVAPGAGSSSNKQIVATNGKDETVLRGTALSGVLRTAYAQYKGYKSTDDEVNQWFGTGLEGHREGDSHIQVTDAIIACKAVNERTHNMVNRHTGAVAKGALFTLESLPPMSKALLSFTLKDGAGEEEQYETFKKDLATILSSNLLVGGSSNRGIGRMVLNGEVLCQSFDLSNSDGVADFMDAEYKERTSGVQLVGDPIEKGEISEKTTITIELGIPRGEDILVGDGQERDYSLQPQRVMIDGQEHWRIPGASLRGIFRGWMTRLAARDGEEVRDSNSRWEEQFDDGNQEYKAHLSGWGFEEDDRETYQNNPSLLNDPILDLFGSMYKKGRIHIADSFAKKESEAQERMHVAVDRFSGGANEGALFNNQVLTGSKLRFPVTISIDSPKEKEMQRLEKTLIALHLGILRVGSSKSGGRLEIKKISATNFDTSKIENLMEVN